MEKEKNPNRILGMLKAQEIRKQKLAEKKQKEEQDKLQYLLSKYKTPTAVEQTPSQTGLGTQPTPVPVPALPTPIKKTQSKKYESDSDSDSDSSGEELVYIKPRKQITKAKEVKEEKNDTSEIEKLKKEIEMLRQSGKGKHETEEKKRDEYAEMTKTKAKNSEESEYLKNLIKWKVLGSF